jgi:hypothetical protein
MSDQFIRESSQVFFISCKNDRDGRSVEPFGIFCLLKLHIQTPPIFTSFSLRKKVLGKSCLHAVEGSAKMKNGSELVMQLHNA